MGPAGSHVSRLCPHPFLALSWPRLWSPVASTGSGTQWVLAEAGQAWKRPALLPQAGSPGPCGKKGEGLSPDTRVSPHLLWDQATSCCHSSPHPLALFVQVLL